MRKMKRHTLLPLPEGSSLIPSSEVPKYLGIAEQTLARWRSEGIGPAYVKLSRRLVAYQTSELKEWMRSQTVVHSAA